MKKLMMISLTILLSLTSTAHATEAEMKEELVKIINQLQQIKPLIEAARKAQPKDPRIIIHFDPFKDRNGVHQGLKQDLEAIQQALITAIDDESIMPRSYAPIQHDFIEDLHGY